jgi:hypothetical protein
MGQCIGTKKVPKNKNKKKGDTKYQLLLLGLDGAGM